jgi:uncharacterized protein (DUF362 family)
MEGDGPIMGTPKPMGTIVMGENLPAVDAHTVRLMGLRPEKMEYLAVSDLHGGTTHPWRIHVEGDEVAPSPFEVIESMAHLKA